MNEPIRVSAEAMHRIADNHDEVAETIASARSASTEVHAAVATYGPIMHRVKAAVGDLLTRRDDALTTHEDVHRRAAEALRRDATGFTSVDEQNAERIRGVQ